MTAAARLAATAALALLTGCATLNPPPPVDLLSHCLPRVLSELAPEDRDAITLCDIQGMGQKDYARRLGLTLPAAKSRVQRARQRLRTHMAEVCQVRFDEDGKVCCFVPRPGLGGKLA